MSLDLSLTAIEEVEIFERNITHNLANMAAEAGLYEVMWGPVENGIIYAKDAIPYLQDGVLNLKERPEYFKRFNPANGWGNYQKLLECASSFLEKCKERPEAKIKARG